MNAIADERQIVNVTNEVIRDYFEETMPSDYELSTPVKSIPEARILNGFPSITPTRSQDLPTKHTSMPTSASPPTLVPTVSSASVSMGPPDLPSGFTPLPTPSALDAAGFNFLSPQLSESTIEDGVFLPGSQYQELHAQLRTRIIDTARSTVPSRLGTPEIDSSLGNADARMPDAAGPDDGDWSRMADLTVDQEFTLLQNYIDEVAPWLDKFDLQRHFELVLPPLAKSHAHLKYAILAVSARQIERKEHKLDYSTSLALYAHAIHLLSPLLHRRTTEVLASCVILCVLEMLSCSPRAWRRHLDGCAALIQALGISGACGGLEQALFWVFARMDIVGGLVSSEKTLIPMHNWMGGGDIALDLALFSAHGTTDMYANQMEYLCGKVIDLLCSSGRWESRHHKRSNVLDMIDYGSEWLQLFELVEQWYQHRPEGMKALIAIPSQAQDPCKPFPTIYFGNGPAISGNQMYHTTALIMLKHRPAHVHFSKKPQSMLWHARQICAISISNSHHGSWTNSTQPLWIAGQQMSHPSEHRAILEILERIERESGWASKWRADDLKEFWGYDIEM
jgi:hypothetical protein